MVTFVPSTIILLVGGGRAVVGGAGGAGAGGACPWIMATQVRYYYSYYQ